jgi:magnesium-transporting ATPase (P-type)
MVYRGPPVTTQSVEKPPRAIHETPITGLSARDVAARVGQGQINVSGEHTSRSLAEILRANLFTRFNLILGILLVVILIVGQLQDALFGIVLVSNGCGGQNQTFVPGAILFKALDPLIASKAPPS